MAIEKSCMDCWAKFLCGPVGDKQCWCFYKPHVLPYYAADGDCVCPACFDLRVARVELLRRDQTKKNSTLSA